MLTVRVATLADLDTIVALRLALLQEADDSPVYHRLRADAVPRARRLFRQQLESPDEVTFLAERDGVTTGVLRCVESHGSPLLEPERYAYVSSVYVVPAARRTGVLRALLDRAGYWCRDRGLDEMRLHSVADAAAANAAWDALGFTIVEHLRVRPLGLPGAAREAVAGSTRSSESLSEAASFASPTGLVGTYATSRAAAHVGTER
jgi:aminoglycoside 6'-N-acetyltransferase I